jgi:hypothetical protein
MSGSSLPRVTAFVMISATCAVPAAAQGIPQRVQALEQRIAALENAVTPPTGVTVDCGAGESVNAALAQGLGGSGPLTVTIRGTCTENVVVVNRDAVLVGASAGDGLEATSATSVALLTLGPRNLRLVQLTLRGGLVGLVVNPGGVVTGRDVRITGSAVADATIEAGHLQLDTSTIEDSGKMGVQSKANGNLVLRNSIVRNNGFHGVSADGGSVAVINGSIENNGGGGVFGRRGSAINLVGARVSGNNRSGIALQNGSTVQLDTGTVIADNAGSGLSLSASTASLRGVTIENNDGNGVEASGGSAIQLSNEPGVFIRANHGDGIWLEDASVVGATPGSPQIQITGNDGAGVACQPAPAVAQIQLAALPGGRVYPLDASNVFGNGQMQINCPGIVVP